MVVNFLNSFVIFDCELIFILCLGIWGSPNGLFSHLSVLGPVDSMGSKSIFMKVYLLRVYTAYTSQIQGLHLVSHRFVFWTHTSYTFHIHYRGRRLISSLEDKEIWAFVYDLQCIPGFQFMWGAQFYILGWYSWWASLGPISGYMWADN